MLKTKIDLKHLTANLKNAFFSWIDLVFTGCDVSNRLINKMFVNIYAMLLQWVCVYIMIFHDRKKKDATKIIIIQGQVNGP